MPGPFDAFRAMRAQARADHKPVKLSIPARVRDTGNPSPAAIKARASRMLNDIGADAIRKARVATRGDYSTPTYKREQ